MEKLYWLDQIKLQDRAKVGEKAFHLSKIIQRGYPVVPGFVISAEVLRSFLENLHSCEALVADLPDSSLHLDVDNWRQLQQVAKHLRQETIAATVPEQLLSTIFQAAKEWQTTCLILRPTLVLTNATSIGNISGLLESVFCRCEEEALAEALKQAWSQIFRAKSLLYWQRSGINLQQINLAVLVQPVQNAIASGLVTTNFSGWEIQACSGLGVAIANGEVLPDVYYIQRENNAVIERHLGNKTLVYRVADAQIAHEQLLTTVETLDNSSLIIYLLHSEQQYALPEQYLQQLIELAKQLESEVGKNFSFEWTIWDETPKGKLYLTQVSAPQSTSSDSHLLKGIGAATGHVTATAHVIINSQQISEQLSKEVILVASAIAPDWLPLLQQVGGVITEDGGLTSHAAILARELGIPAVVSVKDATATIQPGEQLLVDGDNGEIFRLSLSGATEQRKILPHAIAPLPDRTIAPLLPQQPIIATRLLLNLSQPNLIEQVVSLPVDGVGLLRSEMMALNILDKQHPLTWVEQGRKLELLERWQEQIMQFVRAFAPRPVFYRSLDWRSQELLSFSKNVKPSLHPMLGERGTFSYVVNPAIFELELAALAAIHKAGYSNINLMLPFVRTVEEFSFCRRKVELAGLTQVRQFQLWIMAEVPSVLFLLPEYVKAGVQGISIGTNDLTQLLLGVDREQGQLAKAFDERHPALMGAVAQLIGMARNAGIPCSICGQAPALYPEIIENLVEWGISSISVEPEAVPRTYQAIARAEHRIILEAARQQLH